MKELEVLGSFSEQQYIKSSFLSHKGGVGA